MNGQRPKVAVTIGDPAGIGPEILFEAAQGHYRDKDYAQAIAGMKRALSELKIDGIKTTVPLLLELLDHSAFAEGRVDTTFIERTWPG